MDNWTWVDQVIPPWAPVNANDDTNDNILMIFLMSTACAKKIWDTLYNALFKCRPEHITQVSLIGDVNDVSNTIYGEERHQTQWAWCSGGKLKGGVIYLSFSILPSLLIICPLVVLRSPDGVKTECAPTDFGSIVEFVWLQIGVSFCLSFSILFICCLSSMVLLVPDDV